MHPEPLGSSTHYASSSRYDLSPIVTSRIYYDLGALELLFLLLHSCGVTSCLVPVRLPHPLYFAHLRVDIINPYVGT